MQEQELYRSMMQEQELYRSMIWSSMLPAQDANVPMKSFPVVEGTISGRLMYITNPKLYETINTKSFSKTFGIPDGQQLEEAGRQYFLLTGEQVGEAYYYPLQMTVQPGKAIAVLELATDPVAHTQLIAVGTPTAQFVHSQHHQGESHQQVLSGQTLTGPGGVPKSASYETAWYDPVGIKVNSVTDTINFTYNGKQITAYGGSDNRWWLPDGWFEAAHAFSSGHPGGNGTGSPLVFFSTFAHMQNNSFCPDLHLGGPTHVFYHNNVLTVYANGAASGGHRTYDNGGCSSWLHYSSILQG